MAARVLNVLIGVWLFISAFAWHHSFAQFTNTWILGVLCVVFALVAMQYPWVSYLNTALAVWLFLSAILLPRINTATTWNNLICAIAIFVVSLVPSETAPIYRPQARTPA